MPLDRALVTLKTVQSRSAAVLKNYCQTNYLHYAQAVHVGGNDRALGLCITFLNPFIHSDCVKL